MRENVWEPWGDLPQNCFEPNVHLPQRNVTRQKAILPQNFLIMAEDPKATAVGKSTCDNQGRPCGSSTSFIEHWDMRRLRTVTLIAWSFGHETWFIPSPNKFNLNLSRLQRLFIEAEKHRTINKDIGFPSHGLFVVQDSIFVGVPTTRGLFLPKKIGSLAEIRTKNSMLRWS